MQTTESDSSKMDPSSRIQSVNYRPIQSTGWVGSVLKLLTSAEVVIGLYIGLYRHIVHFDRPRIHYKWYFPTPKGTRPHHGIAFCDGEQLAPSSSTAIVNRQNNRQRSYVQPYLNSLVQQIYTSLPVTPIYQHQYQQKSNNYVDFWYHRCEILLYLNRYVCIQSHT